MFREIITLVALARSPVVLELLAILPVPHEPVVHFCGLGGLWLQVFCYKSQRRGVVCLDGRWRLFVAHLFQQLPRWYRLA